MNIHITDKPLKETADYIIVRFDHTKGEWQISGFAGGGFPVYGSLSEAIADGQEEANHSPAKTDVMLVPFDVVFKFLPSNNA